MVFELLAAGANAAPQNKFGFMEAMKTGGAISVTTVVILAVMSFGSFFILFTKWNDQRKILNQGREVGAAF